MGKSSTLLPAYANLRRGNSDYGANNVNATAFSTLLSSHSALTPTYHLIHNSPSIYTGYNSISSTNAIRGQYYVN